MIIGSRATGGVTALTRINRPVTGHIDVPLHRLLREVASCIHCFARLRLSPSSVP
jgi:hypothetical protein